MGMDWLILTYLPRASHYCEEKLSSEHRCESASSFRKILVLIVVEATNRLLKRFICFVALNRLSGTGVME